MITNIPLHMNSLAIIGTMALPLDSLHVIFNCRGLPPLPEDFNLCLFDGKSEPCVLMEDEPLWIPSYSLFSFSLDMEEAPLICNILLQMLYETALNFGPRL